MHIHYLASESMLMHLKFICVFGAVSGLRINQKTEYGDFEQSIKSVFKTASKDVPSEDLIDGVLVFIPGASNKRIGLVQKHLEWLRNQSVPFECIIYEYEDFSLSEEEMRPCKVFKNKGQWMDHFLKVPLNSTKMKYVLQLSDGVEIQHVDLRRMIRTMIDNDLVHVAPALYGKKLYPENKPHLGFGRFVEFLEFHMDLFTRDNFACLQDILDTKGAQYAVNHFGWGVDVMMPVVCQGKIGVIDAMKIYKVYHGSYNTTSAKQEMQKWIKSHDYHPRNPRSPKKSPDTLGALVGTVLASDPQCNGQDSCLWQ